MRLVDLSHTVTHGLVTYPGLPAPSISDLLSFEDSHGVYADGTEFTIGRIDMVANTGTYLDTPFHRYADGRDLAAMALDCLAGVEALTVRFAAGAPRAITRARLEAALGSREVAAHAVLVHTGWDAHWRTERYGAANPFLTADACELLLARGVRLVGTDSVNLDDLEDPARPAHSMLLRAGVPIVEHLTNLAALPDAGFRFFAVPPKVAGMGSWAVRAYAEVSSEQ